LVLNAASLTPSVYSVSTDATGAFTASLALSPLGISGVQYSVPSPNTAGTAIVPTIVTSLAPYLPWLYNQSRGFERYRVLRAVAIFVSSVGSTSTGRVLLDSSTDFADTVSVNGISTSTGGKVFDLGSGAVKEMRFTMDVDTSWKKVSSATQLVSGIGTVLPVNTVNDLLFTTMFVTVSGGPASTPCGSVFVEYDVEFRDPISFGANV